MKQINFDILTNPGEFEVILIPCSTYQKKGGDSPVMCGSMLEEIVAKCPSLPSKIGKAVEQYGNCPAILNHIPGTKYPTKFMTFPVSPPALRAEDPDRYVYSRLKGKFKKFSLLPGWTLAPRSDMVEFSSIKMLEIIRYYKLSKVALPYELFTFDEGDKTHRERTIEIVSRIITDALFIVHRPKEKAEGTIIQSVTTSQKYMEE